MAEMLGDSQQDAGQSPESPSREAPEPTLGDGMEQPDRFLGDPESSGEQSAAQQEADEDQDESATTTQPDADADTKDTDREGTLRWQDYTRKTQDLADERRKFDQERQQWYAEREKALQQRQQAPAPPPPAGQAPATMGSLAQQIEQAMLNPELSGNERVGLQVIGNMARELDQAKAALDELRQFRQQAAPQLQQAQRAAQSLTQRQNQEQMRVLARQYREAQDTFGPEALQGSRDFIKRNLQALNPRTKEPYTISELVAMATGRSVEEAQTARQGAKQQRTAAKKRVAPQGAHPAQEPDAGPLSKQDALAAIAATM